MVQNFARMPPDPLEGIFAVLIFIEQIAQHSDHNRVTTRQRLLSIQYSWNSFIVCIRNMKISTFQHVGIQYEPGLFCLRARYLWYSPCDSRCLYRVSISAAAAEASHWQWHCDGDLPGGRLRTLLPTLHSLPLPTHFHCGPCREVQHTVPQVQVCTSQLR